MAKNLFLKYENRFNLIQQLPTGHHSLKLTIILEPKIEKNEKLLIPSWFQWYTVKKFSALCSATTYFLESLAIGSKLDILYHFNYSNRTVQSVISFTKITYRTAKIFHKRSK